MYRGLFGADRDRFLRTSQPWGRAEIAPKRPFLAQLAPFGPSPCLLSPRLDFHDDLCSSYNFGVRRRVVFKKGGFGGCSPGTETGTRVHSDVPPERKQERGHVRMFHRNEKPERGYARQSHPFTKPPCCFLES